MVASKKRGADGTIRKNWTVTPLDKTVGERIRDLRLMANLSQSEFGKKIGVGGQHVGNWERTTVQVSLEWIYIMSTRFGVPVAYFIDEDNSRGAPDARLIKFWENMSDEDKAKFLRIGKILSDANVESVEKKNHPIKVEAPV